MLVEIIGRVWFFFRGKSRKIEYGLYRSLLGACMGSNDTN